MSEWKQLYAEVLDREPPASLSLRVSILAADAHADETQVDWSRRVAFGLAAAAVTVAVLIVLALAAHSRSSAPAPAKPEIPTLRPATNGRLAVDVERSGQIYLVRAGEKARRLEVPGAAGASVACPAWSPDGTRLLFGRVTGSSQTGSSAAELVIVPVGSDGAIGAPKVIALDGFEVLPGFDAHPCGTWSPDGRWIAFAGTGAVWAVDTQTGLPPVARPPAQRSRVASRYRRARDRGRHGRGSGRPHALHADHHLLDGHRRAQPPRRRQGRAHHVVSRRQDPGIHRRRNRRGTALAGRRQRHQQTVARRRPRQRQPRHRPRVVPTGDRIAYQRLIPGRGEAHNVVLVNVADGTERTIAPPVTNGSKQFRANRSEQFHWYPYAVWWSPDGTTLLYAAWSEAGPDYGGPEWTGLITVPADRPNHATVLIANGSDMVVPSVYSHQWATQMWGRQPD